MGKLVGLLSALVVLGFVAGCALGQSCGKNTRAIVVSDFDMIPLENTALVGGYTFKATKPDHPKAKLELYGRYHFYLSSLNLTLTNVKKLTVRLAVAVSGQTQIQREVHNIPSTGNSLSLHWPGSAERVFRIVLDARPRRKGPAVVRIDSLAACNTRGYSGCYDIALGDYSARPDDQMTVDVCRQFCFRSYTYAALTAYDDMDTQLGCYCFDRIEGSSTDESQCNKPCPGDPSEICGGDLAFSVYREGSG